MTWWRKDVGDGTCIVLIIGTAFAEQSLQPRCKGFLDAVY